MCFVPLSKNINNKIVKNSLIINKIKHPKRGRKNYKMDGLGTRWMDMCMCNKKKPPTKVNNKGNINKSNIQTPPIIRNT